jgi:hypothetical protein
MRRLAFLITLAAALPASALETVTIKSGYRFRREPIVSESTRIRTLWRSTPATLLETRGAWRKVCVNGRGKSCRGGEVGWVINKGLRAPSPDQSGGQEGATQCFNGECARQSKRSVREVVAPIADDLDKNPTGHTLPKSFDPRCSIFISKKGWGEWGRHLDRAANKVAPRCFYERNMFGSICPNYKALSTKDKNAMIALTGAAIGTVESNCNPKVRAQGSNDVAVGIFQMEGSARARAAADRDPRWCRTRDNIDAHDPVFQTECSVSIIDDRICTLGAYIFDGAGYWQKLRHNRKITQLIRSTAASWGLCESGR